MNKTLHYLGLAAIMALPLVVSADEVSPDDDPVKLTISYDVTSPSETFGSEAPKEYVIDFSVSTLKINNVTYNGEYTKTAEATTGKDATFTGNYAYLLVSTSGQPLQSAPLEFSLNDDKTVSLKLNTTETPLFAAALENKDLYTLTLVVPENLFTVNATNITNKSFDLLSIAQKFTFVHTGDKQFARPSTVTPAEGSTVERLGTIDLSFNISVPGHENVTWSNTVSDDIYPAAFIKYAGESGWSENGAPSASIDAADPTKATVKVRPAMTAEAQYRIDIPMGTFVMTAKDASGEVVATYVNPDLSYRYAIGMEVQDGLPKSTILGQCVPNEGSVNLEQVPSGVEYLQISFKSMPTLDRSVTEPLQLFYNDGETPIKELSPRNETFIRLQTQGVSNGYDHVLNIFFDGGESNIVMPGKYKAVIPAGFLRFGEDQEPNARMELHFQINKVLNFEVYPTPQITMESLEELTMIFPNCNSVRVNEENTTPIHIVTRNGAIAFDVTDVTTEGKVVRMKFAPQTTNGTYIMTIPDNYFRVDLDGEILPNQVIEREWTVRSLAYPTIEPAPGVLSSNVIKEVNFDLGEDAEITDIFRGDSFTRLLRVDDNGEILYKPILAYFKIDLPDNSIGNSYFTMVPTDNKAHTLEPGNYVFLPCRYLYTLKGGDQNGELFYFWTVLPSVPEFAKPEVTPNENVLSSNLFTMKFPENTVISSRSYEFSYLYPLNEDGTTGESVAKFKAMAGGKPNEVELVNISGVAPLEKGVYSLRTPKGICWNSENVAGAYNFDIYVGMSGVHVLGEHGSSYDVFTLDGICVLKAATPEQINALAPGIYVVGGKKIRK